MTKQDIVDKLHFLRDGCRVFTAGLIRSQLVELIAAVEALPDPEAGVTPPHDAGTEETLRRWRPGHSMVAMVPDDCPISLRAAVKAGARIVIEPAGPES
jgi:hypothetical protein